MRRVMLAAVLTVALSACWQQAGFDSGGSNFSPLPVGVTAANVGTLTHAFTYPVKNANAMVVSNGRAFVVKDRLYAFDAAGTTGCTGSPAVCTPVWTSSESGTFQSVVVGGGRVWVSYVNPQNAATAILGYDLAGADGCAGTPLVCHAVVTLPNVAGSLRWADDRLHVSINFGTSSFTALHRTYTADGTLVWSATIGSAIGPLSVPPQVLDGDVLITATGNSGTPVAYDARGITGCSGSPTTCTPMWTYDATASVLAARDGRLYAVHGDRLAAYDAHGVDNCFGSPKVCYPLWTTSGPAARAVVTGDRMFVAHGGGISAYPLNLSSCSGAIPSCRPTGSGSSVDAFDLVADAGAGGLVYGTRKTCTSLDCAPGTVSWYLDAWDAGQLANGCATVACHEVWAGSVPGPAAEVEIVDGAVYYRPETLNNAPPADIWGFRPAA